MRGIKLLVVLSVRTLYLSIVILQPRLSELLSGQGGLLWQQLLVL